jgi:hypothetical protein
MESDYPSFAPAREAITPEALLPRNLS